MPQRKIWCKKKLFFDHYRLLEVIWNSFGPSELNSQKRNRLKMPKNLYKTYNMSIGRFVLKVKFSGQFMVI